MAARRRPPRLGFLADGDNELTGRPAPRFPVYIPSKSRAGIALTPGVLDGYGVPYRIIVEEHQYADYAAAYGASRLLVLPPGYQDAYDTCDDLGRTVSLGSGPARNFAWEHSISEGHAWHWVIDDNIQNFARLYRNRRIISGDALPLTSMENFCLRYENIGLAGPEYWMFAPSRQPQRDPFKINRRVFSTILIRNDTRLRWRGRYNEDLLLSIAMIKAGWCTVTFLAFLQHKTPTQRMPGGNTEAFYKERGTLEKSQMAAREYPDMIRVVYRYGRWHHYVDWSAYADMSLVRRPGYDDIVASQGSHGTRTIPRPEYRQARKKARV